MILVSILRDVVALSALLHDTGKSNKAFQTRLQDGLNGGDYYRHEYLSLKIFLAMIEDCESDTEWLERFSTDEINQFCTKDYIIERINKQVEDDSFDMVDISNIPPLARLVAWLVVTHHRLPPSTQTDLKDKRKRLNKLKRHFDTNTSKSADLGILYKDLNAYAGWQKNIIVKETDAERALLSTCFDVLITESSKWRDSVNLCSQKILNNKSLFDGVTLCENGQIDSPLVLQLARLLLVLSDHNYSALGDNDLNKRLTGDNLFSGVYANSNADSSIRQPLDEHLMGVSSCVYQLSDSFNETLSNLPALKKTDTLSSHTNIERFYWQNTAYDTAYSLHEESKTNGFFCVNLASTGCGKTIANARIMKAVSKDNTRFTVALGLRTLTLQTADSFKKDLGLSKGDLAVVVGGEANTELYYMREDNSSSEGVRGSESVDLGFRDNVYSDLDYDSYKGLDTLLNDSKSQKMLLSPLLVCTIDHIIQASEGLHGGRNIAPSLRLMSGDLILDEPDDFGVDDLPALSRLVFVAGMYGSRVILSSATLTPSMVSFLFDAYLSGRKLFNESNDISSSNAVNVPCMLVDEQDCEVRYCKSEDDAYIAFNEFSYKRSEYLSSLPVRRKAEIMPMDDLSYDNEFPEFFFESLAQSVVNQACNLHDRFHEVDESTGQSISVGLIRLTYTKSVIALAKELVSSVEVDEDTCIHFCCYHSRQLLAMRNELEVHLDSVLSRSDKSVLLKDKPEIKNAIADSSCSKHIFIVLATPIAEVGRDHDYDWAIVEPSSMRSIIQLSGRVWRHRPDKIAYEPNVAIMQYNLKYFTRDRKKDKVFIHSGFESEGNSPAVYKLDELMPDDALAKIDSRPRIIEESVTYPPTSLSQIEHNRIRQVLSLSECCLANSIWHPTSRMYSACTDVYILTKFRENDDVELEYVATLTPHEELGFYVKKELLEKSVEDATCKNHIIVRQDFESQNPNIRLWLDFDILDVSDGIQKERNYNEVREVMLRYFTVQLRDTDYFYNEFLGFY